ncbi:MAG TPA: molybdopterin dinucleotide binding domain-containing protein, partial [Actinomycetota bacterium]
RDELGATHDAGDDDAEPDRLVLFTYPLLVDEGRLSEGADELKAALEDDAFLEVHPDDADRLGLADGDRAVVRTEAGEAEVAVRVSEHIAAGAAFVPFNQAGFAANTLLSGRTITAATVQPVDALETAGVGAEGEA